MKKTYIAPEVLIVDIETQFTIAMSMGRSYNPDDVSYESESRSNLWGED